MAPRPPPIGCAASPTASANAINQVNTDPYDQETVLSAAERLRQLQIEERAISLIRKMIATSHASIVELARGGERVIPVARPR